MAESIRTLLNALDPGARIYLPGSSGEVSVVSELLAAPDAPALDITQTFVPGINPSLGGKLPAGSSWVGPFANGARGSQATEATGQLACSYAGFRRHLERSTFDLAIVHVAPPQQGRFASLGAAVEFAPIAIQRSRRFIAVVNTAMPAIPGAETIDLDVAELVVEIEQPLREYDVGAPSADALAVARYVAEFVDDGATIQIGLGKVPDALLAMLADRRRLCLHSGMLSDGTRTLFEAGAMDEAYKHTSCVHVGTKAYYSWLAGRPGIHVRGCDHTHSPAVLAGMDGLVAVNSALAVDLFGAANLEILDGRAVSGVGGAADFARAASLAPDGISIVALPAASPDGANSRIVPTLQSPVSLPRHDIDVVITEYGAADLRGSTVMERARRLIAVSHPNHREALDAAWHEIARKL